MKGIFLFLIVVLLISPLSYAYSDPYSSGSGVSEVAPKDKDRTTNEIFSAEPSGGIINNKAPVVTLNYPTDGKVVNGNLVEFSWLYSDAELDSQVNYQIELDDDFRFLSPLNFYGFGETKRKVYILDGNKIYYWRVKSKDNFKWGSFSDIDSFYLDSTKKVCEDGTSYFQCSLTNLKFCEGGELVDNCGVCGCPLNSECSLSGTCVEKVCLDGTRYGSCSNKEPGFCQNGELKDVCSLCGCPENKECNKDGSCDSVIIKDVNIKEDIIIKEPQNVEFSGLISRFLGFLKKIILG